MTVNGPKTRATADVGRLREELTSKDVAKYTVRHPGDGDVFMKVQNAICCYTTGEPVPNVVAPPISLILVGIQPPVYLGACLVRVQLQRHILGDQQSDKTSYF